FLGYPASSLRPRLLLRVSISRGNGAGLGYRVSPGHAFSHSRRCCQRRTSHAPAHPRPRRNVLSRLLRYMVSAACLGEKILMMLFLSILPEDTNHVYTR